MSLMDDRYDYRLVKFHRYCKPVLWMLVIGFFLYMMLFRLAFSMLTAEDRVTIEELDVAFVDGID